MGGPLAVRLPTALLLLVLGGATAVGTVVLHARWWGLALGVAATLAVLAALPGGWWTRLAFALGWVSTLSVLAGERTEGDYLVAADLPGYLLLGAGLVVLVGGLVGVLRRPSAARGSGEPVARPGTREDSGRVGQTS